MLVSLGGASYFFLLLKNFVSVVYARLLFRKLYASDKVNSLSWQRST